MSVRVRERKSLYFRHALAYLKAGAMNTPYDAAMGMLPFKSGNFTILNGKSSRLSCKVVSCSLSTMRISTTRYDAC